MAKKKTPKGTPFSLLKRSIGENVSNIADDDKQYSRQR